MSVGPRLTIALKGMRGKDYSTMCWITWFVSPTHWELVTTWEHYRFAMDGDYGIAQGAAAHNFWVTIFSMRDFFSSLP
jgi:hypothetical protein